jgi:hypothetical protein
MFHKVIISQPLCVCCLSRPVPAVELVVGVFELMGLFGLVGKEH